jgi:hypothetical protein
MTNLMRLVLRPWVTRLDVEFMASDLAWVLNSTREPAYALPGYRAWAVESLIGITFVLFTEDLLAEKRYVILEGPDIERLAVKVRSYLATCDIAEVIATLEKGREIEHKVDAVRTLGVAATKFYDEQIFRGLLLGLRDPAVPVRLAALSVVGFANWSELIEPVRELASADPDATVVRRATRMASLLAK